MFSLPPARHILILIGLLNVTLCASRGLKLFTRELVARHQWSYFEMGFPSAEILQAQISIGQYLNTKVLPVDFAIDYKENGGSRVFLTFPRLNIGVPYSLALVADDMPAADNAKVWAYPSYDWHYNYASNCSGITSAIRIFIDSHHRLWVFDSGQINSLQCCAPKIMAFNLADDSLVHEFSVPHNLFVPGLSVFTDLTVDVDERDADAAMLYISDTWGYGIIVYDASEARAWRIEHELMQPDEKLRNLNMANDGVFTVNLSPQRVPPQERKLFFHSLNSHKEVSVPLAIVNNASLWLSPSEDQLAALEQFSVVGDRGTPCESEAIDSEGNMFCSMLNANAIVKWNGRAPYNADSLEVVVYNPEQIRFITSLKVLRNSDGVEELWALSQEPTLFVGGHVNKDDIKFMLLGCRIEDLLRNKPCSLG